MPSKIEWTDETWNPVTGCTKVSAGCANCYAERMARRLAGRYGYPEAPNHFAVTLHPERLEQPLRWQKPRTVFVCSMSDWLHPEVPFSFAAKMFAVMSQAKQHTFQLLTKRADRLAPFFRWAVGGDGMPLFTWPLPNVWLGVTAENQAAADERIPLLLQTPAVVRFVSFEPLLGAIRASIYLRCPICGMHNWNLHRFQAGHLHTRGLDWLIVGGESGPGARPMHPDWARSLRDQAQAAGVPFFMKQMSKRTPIPDDLMIREFPSWPSIRRSRVE